MDTKSEYKKLGDVQKRDIDQHVQEALNGIEGMRGCNDRQASPVHAWLHDTLEELIELQEAGFFNDAKSVITSLA